MDSAVDPQTTPKNDGQSAELAEAGRIIGTFWDQRFKREGQIWGSTPSPTAVEVVNLLERPGAKILDVGFGYARDFDEYLANGHTVHGIETARIGLNMAMKRFAKEMSSGRAHFIGGEFTTASMGNGDFDVVASHRMLHLLKGGNHVRAFANRAFNVLRPGGLLVVSARDDRDFDAEQMKRNPDGSAEYTIPGREGHLISFWDKARFGKVFGQKFNIEQVIQGTEPESEANTNHDAHFSIMVARKKILSPQPGS